MEADLLRFYQIDLLDFYRGTLSARRLGVLVKKLPAKSATTRAVNGGEAPWTRLEHLIADCWVVLVKIAMIAPKSRVSDHPRRAEMEAKARYDAKSSRVAELKAKYRSRKRKYGLG